MDGFDSIRTSDPPARQLGSGPGSGIWLGEEVVYFFEVGRRVWEWKRTKWTTGARRLERLSRIYLNWTRSIAFG